MKNICVIVVCVTLLSGCETIRDMMTKVHYYDGIDEKEAMYIAQEKLIWVEQQKHFHKKRGAISTDKTAREYPNIWFIKFPPRKKEDSGKYFLVMIVKETGQVLQIGVRPRQ